MERAMNKKGFTLVEMLVAIALLSLVLSMVSSGVVTAMKANRVHDAASASQTRARRVLEIVSQDLRSAALGGVINTPYTSGSNAVSFAQLAGGAGYEARFRFSNATFITSTSTTAALPDWNGSSILTVLDDGGEAYVAPFTARWRTNVWGGLIGIIHNNCGIGYSTNGPGPNANSTPALTGTQQSNDLLFNVNAIGYRFDAAQNRLLQRTVGGNEIPVAFDIEDFTVSYIYRNKTTGALNELTAPIESNGVSLIEDNTWRLAQLQIDLDVAEPSSGRDSDGSIRTVARTYTSYVDLADGSASFQVGRVGTC